MKKLIAAVVLMGALAGAVLALVMNYRPPKKPLPVMSGTQVIIDSGKHHIEGTLESASTYDVLFKDEGVSLGAYGGDALVSTLNRSTADRLKAQYGDFFTCGEPGAVQSLRELETVILVGRDEQTQDGITEALALVRQSKIPVVRLTGAVLDITAYTFDEQPIRGANQIPIYYIWGIEILEESFMP